MRPVLLVSTDGTSAIVASAESTYSVVTLNSPDVVVASSLPDARGRRMWREPSERDLRLFKSASELVIAAGARLDVERGERSERRRVYRVPKSVRIEAARGARWATKQGATDDPALELATRLSKSESVDIDTVRELAELSLSSKVDTSSEGFRPGEPGYPNRDRVRFAMLGGSAGSAWTRKTGRVHQLAITASGFSYDDSLTYFGGGPDESTTEVGHLYSVDAGDNWSERVSAAWQRLDAPPTDPLLIELDEESATTLADYLDETSGHEVLFELRNVDPAERNLFELALVELDLEELDRAAFALRAAGYTPQERSQNAQRQNRSSDGKFGSGGAGPQTSKLSGPLARARLPRSYPLVADAAALIAAYLDAQGADPARTETELADAAPAPVESPDSGGAKPLYLALVDAVDRDAVLDIVAIAPGTAGGDASAWRRSEGAWVPAPQILADLRGATPPPVVELPDETVVKSVLSQVDNSDAGRPTEPIDTEPVTQAPPVVSSALYGAFGEVIPAMVAAGVPGIADTPSDHAAVARLKKYWTVGKGGAKVRWNTPGDMTRCMRYTRKYLQGREAGFCALLHKRMTGVWPGDKRNVGKRG